MKTLSPFYLGMLGGFTIIGFFIILLLSVNFFNYRIIIEDININTADKHDIAKHNVDTTITGYNDYKKMLLKQLTEERSILTPNEYTNNIVNYYNNMLLILSVMLATFSFLSFIYIKSIANDSINDKLNSNDFIENVSILIAGNLEGRLREEISGLSDDIQDLENRIAELYEQA